MKIQFTNNASSSLASSISAYDTIINLAGGSGVLFPDCMGTGDHFFATIIGGPGQIEIVEVNSRSNDTLYVAQRGADGTTAQAFDAGAVVELRVTRAAISEVRDYALPLDTTDANTPTPNWGAAAYAFFDPTIGRMVYSPSVNAYAQGNMYMLTAEGGVTHAASPLSTPYSAKTISELLGTPGGSMATFQAGYDTGGDSLNAGLHTNASPFATGATVSIQGYDSSGGSATAASISATADSMYMGLRGSVSTTGATVQPGFVAQLPSQSYMNNNGFYSYEQWCSAMPGGEIQNFSYYTFSGTYADPTSAGSVSAPLGAVVVGNTNNTPALYWRRPDTGNFVQLGGGSRGWKFLKPDTYTANIIGNGPAWNQTPSSPTTYVTIPDGATACVAEVAFEGRVGYVSGVPGAVSLNGYVSLNFNGNYTSADFMLDGRFTDSMDSRQASNTRTLVQTNVVSGGPMLEISPTASVTCPPGNASWTLQCRITLYWYTADMMYMPTNYMG